MPAPMPAKMHVPMTTTTTTSVVASAGQLRPTLYVSHARADNNPPPTNREPPQHDTYVPPSLYAHPR